MCGIVGIADFRGVERNMLTRMCDVLSHRGPNGAGCWLNAAGTVGLGHRRLAIVDLSDAGAQPMESADGQLIIVYNGEIYNYRDLRLELEASGVSLRGTSDSEVLVNAVGCWGLEATLRRSVGMFAFAIWDKRSQVLSLAVDRMGEKPLYYGWIGSAFVFGSELKALRLHPSWSTDIDQEAVALYLRRGYIPAPYSVYRNMRKLEPGTFSQLESGLRTPYDWPIARKYWDVYKVFKEGSRAPFKGGRIEAADELERHLAESVRLQMVADVPVGAFLSGGIDSSVVVALMQRQSRRPIKTFAIGFEDGAYNEAVYARDVARHLGTDHTEMVITPKDALKVIPDLPCIYDEPFADSSQIPTYLVARLARQQVTVSLSGDGGDELFLGYRSYVHSKNIWQGIRWIPTALRRGLAASASAVVDSSGFARIPVRTSIERRIRALIRTLPSASYEEVHARLSSTGLPSAEMHRDIASADCANSVASDGQQTLTRLGINDLAQYLPGDILTKVDRAAMAVSLETRIPFLDHRVVEFALSLPESMKLKRGEGKIVLKDVLFRHVPREFFNRPKKGFAIPLAKWLRGPLRDWVEVHINHSQLVERRLLDRRSLNALWRNHSWQAANCNLLYNIVMMEAWLKRWA